MSLTCELKAVRSTKDFYQQLAKGLKLPATFGHNLDALFDALTGSIEGPATIFWHSSIAARNEMGDEAFENIIGTLYEVSGDNPDLQIWLGL